MRKTGFGQEGNDAFSGRKRTQIYKTEKKLQKCARPIGHTPPKDS